MIKILMSHLEKNFQEYDQLLREKQRCISYSRFKDTAVSCVDSILLIERHRLIQRKNFYVRYGARERAFDFILSFNAKLRFPSVRLFLDLIVLWIQTCTISLLIIFSRKKLLVEIGLSEKFGGIAIYPSINSYAKNLHRPLTAAVCEVGYEEQRVKSFSVTCDIIGKLQPAGALFLFPAFILEMSLYIRRRLNSNFIGLKCLGTMCVVNRFYAVVLKENGYVVYLENHGIVRDCVAEYAIFTQASGYKDGAQPMAEEKGKCL